MGSGCHEGAQDQADQIPNATSQPKASALIRHHHGTYIHARIVNNKDIFLSLCRLGSDSVQKFEESRRLRSRVVPLQAIYLRCRLVAIIDEPFRTRAISQLRLVLEFRKGHYPPTNIPLRLPPLAHDLPREVRHILRFLVQRERVNFHRLSDKQWTRIAGKELRMWCNRWRQWRLPDRVRSGLLHWTQQQLILHHRAL